MRGNVRGLARRSVVAKAAGILVGLFSALLVCSPSYAQTVAPAPEAALSVEQIKEFLKTAKVVRVANTKKGVTAPRRLTLSDGTITHDAVFQAIDQHKMFETLGNGVGKETSEVNFVDSYKYNIAAYEIATLLGLGPMMPVYVERRWDGNVGSLSWFVPTLMDESERLKKKVQPPNPAEWNNQMYRMRVFSSLLRDTDRNLTNVLITHDWKVVMIDFSRAFRLQPELLHEKDLNKIDSQLLTNLERLTRDQVENAVGTFLMPREIDAVMTRRDLLVAHYKQLISTLGEAKVLY